MKPLYKYFPIFVALFIVAILSTGFYGASVVRSLFYERIVVDLEDTAEMLKDVLIAQSPTDIDSFCKIAGTGQSRITIIDDQGIVIGDSIADPAEMDNHAQRSEMSRALLGVLGTSTRYSNTIKRDMVYLALPVFNLSGNMVVLRTATPLLALNGKLRGAYSKIAGAGVIILILVTLLGYILTNRVNGALQIIQNAVREYAKGNLSFRPHVFRPPELKKIADTISDLASDLMARASDASRQKEKLEAVFAAMDEAVIVLDTELCIQEMNDSAYRLSDLLPGEGTGKNLLLAFRNSLLHKLAEKVRINKTGAEEEIAIFSDKKRFLQVHGTFIPGSIKNEKALILLVLNEVTRLKNLEQVRKDFVANVSHELKTPITAVKGYIETLLGGDYKDPEVSENFLHIALKHIDRLNAIIEDLLIISRLEQDSESAPPSSPCALDSTISSVVEMYEQHAENKSIVLDVFCKAGETVLANKVLLEQGLANLVDNAIKYSESQTTITISVVTAEDTIRIEVRDQGRGIPEEHLDRIFERFYRIDSGRSRELGGTGLGLAIVKHVAISHGGQVSVESIEGEGSTFAIILPK